jgi:8-oxo-dGTP diphosphatase
LFKFTDEFFEVVSSVPFGEGILIAFNSDVYSDKIRTKISDMLNCSKFANICSSLGIFNIVFEESVYKPGNVLNHGSTPPPNYKIISKMNCADALDLPKPERSDKPVILVAAAALIDPEGRILIAQRPEGKNMAGLWEFPGGKVDAGETPEYALMRELEEELGIETRPCCFSPIAFASEEYEAFHLLMPLFVCRIWRGIPKALEHAALKWVKPADLYSYPMPPADLPLIAALRDRL